MAGTAYAGTCFLRLDGNMIALDGDWKVQPNSKQRTGKAGPSGGLGFIEQNVIPSISGTAADSGSFSIQGLASITNSTVTLELVNGKTYILSQAWWSGESEVDVMEGKIPVKFEGLSCTELLAA
jgi:hypothetical protein